MAAKKKNQSSAVPGTVAGALNHGPTNYVEIQQNELAALHSIYMEDFEEVKVKAAAWSVSLQLIQFPHHIR